MTTATLLATRCDVRFKGASNAVVTASEWLSHLNEAYNLVNGSSPLWPWLETSEQTISFTAGTRTANLPTDVLAVAWAYDTTDDYRLIDQQAAGDFFHQDHLRSETGQPVTYRLRGSVMELNPTPSANTTVVAQCVLMPTALAADSVTVGSVDGGAAGNLTITGIAVGDTLLSVVTVLNASPFTTANLTSEFTITAANTINNSGGTSTAAKRVAVTYRTSSSSAEPVFPEAYHDILIEAALAAAYLDDGNPGQAEVYEKRYARKLQGMKDAVLIGRTEANMPIRDTFWS